MQPRKCNDLGDFIEFGLIPDLKGLYRTDFLKQMGRPHEDLEFQGVLLSHDHADHASYINHLREDLPIFCSEGTYRILKAMNDTGSGSFNDIVELTRCFETYINKNGELSRKNARSHPDIVSPRTFELFKFGQPFRIDDLEIIPFEVDHSLPGATGYIIHTSSGTVVYSGDFRFHGRRSRETEAFMEACEEAKPDLLLTEGTRINDASSKTEVDVEAEIAEACAKSRGLSVCNWSVRDTDRMLSFLSAAKKLGRKLVISLKQAYLLDELARCGEKLAPSLDDEDIELYASRKSWGLIGSKCDGKLLREDYESWERVYLDRAICYRELRADPEKYLFFCSNFDLAALIDIKPQPQSVYIKSVCEPFDAEMEVDWERISNWIRHLNLPIVATHVSGHASSFQLKKFVEEAKPKVVVPIHTQNAAGFSVWHDKVRLLEAAGVSYTL